MIKKLYKKVLLLSLTTTACVTPLIQPAVVVADNIEEGFISENGIQQYYKNGRKSTETGFVKVNSSWFYIINGKADYKQTGFISGTVNGSKGTFYVNKNKVYGKVVQADTNNWSEIMPVKNTNFRLDVDGSSPKKDKNIWIYTKNSTSAQKFKFKEAGGGYYYILTASSGAESTLGSGTFSKKNLYQNNLIFENLHQKWKIIQLFDGTYAFYNEKTQSFLDIAGDNIYKNKANVWTHHFLENHLEGQTWKISDTKYTGFEKKNDKWIYVIDNKQSTVNSDIVEGIINGVKGWYYIEKGVFKDATTVAKNKHGWWYVKNGKVDFTYNGFAKNPNGWWWIENGAVTFKKNGLADGVINNKKSTYYITDSKVTGEVVSQPSSEKDSIKKSQNTPEAAPEQEGNYEPGLTTTVNQTFSNPDNTDTTIDGYINNGSYSIQHFDENGLYYTRVTGSVPQLTITGSGFNAHQMANNVGAVAAIDAGMIFGEGNYYSYGDMWTDYWGINEGNTLVLRTNSDNVSSCWSFIAQDYNGAYYIGSTPNDMTKSALRSKIHASIPSVRFAYATEGGGHVKYIRNGELIVNGHGESSRTTPGLIWFK